jgi:hypothetical protein
MNKRHVMMAVALTSAGALAGVGMKALADGIPSPNPLYYAGTLTLDGNLVSDPARSMKATLWTNPTPTVGETALCVTSVTTPVLDGRFRIALDPSCKGAINANPNVYVEVVDNAVSLGRAKVGAVPFAVEADHAVSATNAVDGGGIASAITTLQGQSHPPSAFHAWLTLATSIPSGMTTVVALDHVEYDLNEEYDKTTGVFTAGAAGVYLLNCAFLFDLNGPSTNYWSAVLYKNGAQVIGNDVYTTNASTPTISSETSVTTQLSKGDVVTCAAYQNSGAATSLSLVTTRNSFDAARLY